MANLTKNVALTKLQKMLGKIEDLRESSPGRPEIDRWARNTRMVIEEIFGKSSENLDDFCRIQFDTSWTASWDEEMVKRVRQKAYSDGLDTAQWVLQSMIDEVREYWEDEGGKRTTGREKIEILGRAVAESCVFIGHGRSPLWARLQLFLEKELGLETVTYESESRAGESIVPVIEEMLGQANFAVLILTAEDETAAGGRRARQNVVHEAGLFQGRLGFKKAILLVQDGVEDFSNVAGLQPISFSGDRIEQAFWELQRALKKQGLIR